MTTQNTSATVAENLAMKATKAQKSLNKKKQVSAWEKFHRKVAWQSHQYVSFVIQKCEEIANGGYGSCEIKVDKTTDLFMVDEGRNSAYSADFVIRLLQQNGFSLDFSDAVDHYDAISFLIVWEKKLPKSTYQIGMCWEK